MLPWLLILLLIGVFALTNVISPGNGGAKELTFTEFRHEVNADHVKKVEFDTTTGDITGLFVAEQDNTKDFTSKGPSQDLPDAVISDLNEHNVDLEYTTPTSNFFLSLLPLLLPILLIIVFLMWFQRRQQGQMGAVMNIGRSRAKVYNTEKPKTTFEDVAGYGPVKAEIAEVVDFLKHPGKFKQIGARIPKGVLLVGPPGTGKTLIARAVAGEAGVPFISVTGSDFMEVLVPHACVISSRRRASRHPRSSSSTRSTRSGASAARASAAVTTSVSRH
jgi:cell division protease FtsH